MSKSLIAILTFLVVTCLSPAFLNGQVSFRIQLPDVQDQGTAEWQQENIVVASDFAFRSLSGDTIWTHSAMGGLSADPNHLIHDSQVRKNLELDKQQAQELNDIRKDFSRRIQSELAAMQKDGKSFDQKRWAATMKQINKDRKAAMGAVLLPHQSKRLQQISTQMEMKNRGDANALVGNKLAEELGIDDEQKQRLKKRAEEIKRDMEEKIAKIREDGRKELLRELKPDQRKKLNELTGEKFEYKKPQIRRR